ncbi:MAG: hypothetical protein ACTSSN_04005 [Candidatus Heimdallarchaeaceae archaeon]
MRIRDKVFEADWKKTKKTAPGSQIMVFCHHLFGVIAIAIIILQSAISLNVYVFTIWLIIGIINLMIDLFRGGDLNLKNELSFGIFFILGTAFSLLLANVNSMFFPDTLGRIDIIIYQVSAGICIALRLLLSMFFLEFYSQERFYILPTGDYAIEQVKHYEDNLILTDFERVSVKELDVLQKWWILIKKMFWPLISILILILFAGLYSMIIYFIIPPNTIAEFIIRPSLIVVAILYTIILTRMNAILPKIKNETTVPVDNDDEISEFIE